MNHEHTRWNGLDERWPGGSNNAAPLQTQCDGRGEASPAPTKAEESSPCTWDSLPGGRGCGWYSGGASTIALEVAAAAVIAVALFAQLYEEPTLRKMFGAEYEEYCQNVPRWLPRVRPWERNVNRA